VINCTRESSLVEKVPRSNATSFSLMQFSHQHLTKFQKYSIPIFFDIEVQVQIQPYMVRLIRIALKFIDPDHNFNFFAKMN